MSILIIVLSFFHMSTNPTFSNETIPSIDREELFSKYIAPQYEVTKTKIDGLTLEQAQKYLNADVYDYVMRVQADYMEKNKAPIPLFYPKHTREKIENNISHQFLSLEDLSAENINKKVNDATKEYLKVVHGMNQDPVYKTINDLYYEVINLRTQINQLKEKQESKITSTAPSALDKNDPIEGIVLTYAPILLSLIAIGMTFGKKKAK